MPVFYDMQKRIKAALLIIFTVSSLFAGSETKKISVAVIGEVQEPGFYQIDEASAMIDAVAAAGGFTRKAKVWEVLIVSRHGKITVENFNKINREVEQSHESLSSLQKLEEIRKLSKILSDGDTIIVAEPSE